MTTTATPVDLLHAWQVGDWDAGGAVRRSYCARCGAMRVERTSLGRTNPVRSNGAYVWAEHVATTAYLLPVHMGGGECAGPPRCVRPQ